MSDNKISFIFYHCSKKHEAEVTKIYEFQDTLDLYVTFQNSKLLEEVVIEFREALEKYNFPLAEYKIADVEGEGELCVYKTKGRNGKIHINKHNFKH